MYIAFIPILNNSDILHLISIASENLHGDLPGLTLLPFSDYHSPGPNTGHGRQEVGKQEGEENLSFQR